MSLKYELSHTKTRYRELFGEIRDDFENRLNALRQEFTCSHCQESGVMPELLAPLSHPNCGYAPWYRASIRILEQEVGKEVLTDLQKIGAYKKTFSCHMCGVCCRFASSEFSYDELLKKAEQGDSFASQFTSIFLPYASTAEARRKFPEMVDDVLAEVEDAEKDTVHFYHCPYVGEDNRCTIFGSPKRPDLCSSYPDTPLTFIYNKCAWTPWKEETHDVALKAHATIELCSHFLGKLTEALESHEN